jgi:lipopolysaccharide export system protein LptA
MILSLLRPRSVRQFLAALVVGLWGLGAGPALAQVSGDTTAVDTGRTPTPPPAPVAPPDTVRAEDVGPGAQDRALVRADSLSALVRDGQRLQELFDNVRVRQDTTRLRSNFALRYLDRDELLFTGDVVIYERGDTLRADTVRYNKKTKVGRARSNVRLTDGEVVVRAPRAVYDTEAKRSVFPDSVTLVDSTRTLRARSGTYWSNARRAEFQGNVHLRDPETLMVADSLTYYRDQERSIAKGNVFIRREGGGDEADADTAATDTTGRTYLFGRWADNQEQARYSRVEGRGLLVRVRRDSAGAPEDTLAVRGRRLEAFRSDTHRRLIAVDSVRIWQRDLAAVADSTVYDRVVQAGRAAPFARPRPVPDSTAPTRPGASRPADAPARPDADSTLAAAPADSRAEADSLAGADSLAAADSLAPPGAVATADTAETDTSVRDTSVTDTTVADSAAAAPAPAAADTASGAGAWRQPTVSAGRPLPVEETRLFGSPITWFEQSQVWGDSIRVRARERALDTVFVKGRGFAAQEDTTLERIQQLKGKDLTAYFRADSLRRLVAAPNALAIRFLSNQGGGLKGAAKASGDRIVLYVRGGTVRRTSIVGGVESTYYRTPEAVPNPFRLEGFQWTPDRKPTKAALLGEPRVRERLDLSPSAPRPPVARAGEAAAPPDSGQGQSTRSARPPAPRRPRPDSAAAPPDTLRAPPDSLRGREPRPPSRDTSHTSPPDA